MTMTISIMHHLVRRARCSAVVAVAAAVAVAVAMADEAVKKDVLHVVPVRVSCRRRRETSKEVKINVRRVVQEGTMSSRVQATVAMMAQVKAVCLRGSITRSWQRRKTAARGLNRT